MQVNTINSSVSTAEAVTTNKSVKSNGRLIEYFSLNYNTTQSYANAKATSENSFVAFLQVISNAAMTALSAVGETFANALKGCFNLGVSPLNLVYSLVKGEQKEEALKKVDEETREPTGPVLEEEEDETVKEPKDLIVELPKDSPRSFVTQAKDRIAFEGARAKAGLNFVFTTGKSNAVYAGNQTLKAAKFAGQKTADYAKAGYNYAAPSLSKLGIIVSNLGAAALEFTDRMNGMEE